MSTRINTTEEDDREHRRRGDILDRMHALEVGDYRGLITELRNFAGEYEEGVYEQVVRIVSTDTILNYINGTAVDGPGLVLVLNYAIEHYVLLDYPRIMFAVARIRCSTEAFFTLCDQGTAYIVDLDAMLQALGKKPTKRSADMLRYYLGERQSSGKKLPVLFLVACLDLNISQDKLSEMIGSDGYFAVLKYAIRGNANDTVAQLIFSGICLENEEAWKQAIAYAGELNNQIVLQMLRDIAY